MDVRLVVRCCAVMTLAGVLHAGDASAQNKPAAARSARCTIRGKVTDVATGKVVPGYPITVYTQDDSGRGTVRALTDRSGVYKVSVPKGARAILYVIPYDASGGMSFLLEETWMRNWRPAVLTVTRDTVHDIRIKLEAAREVAATFRLPDGKPASGALVMAGNMTARAGAGGKAALKVPKRSSEIVVLAVSSDRKHGSVATLRSGQAALSLQLEPFRTVTGTLIDTDNKPVEGVGILAIPVVEEEPVYGLLEPAQARTDAQGRFEIRGLAAADWMIRWDKGPGIKRGEATVSLKGTTLDPVRAERDIVDPALFRGSVCRTPETKVNELSSFALDRDDNILVCDEDRSKVLKVSQDDRLLAAWDLTFKPEAIAVREDGSVVVAGQGRIAILDASGSEKVSGTIPGRRSVTSVAAEGSQVFVCTQGETGFAVYRMPEDLKEPRKVIGNLTGCCGQMDIAVHQGNIYAAENTRFSIGKYTLDGKKIADFIHSDAKKPDYYGEGCCEPKNLCFGPDGSIYTAASGKMEVKRYSVDGKLLGAVGQLPDADGSCVRVTVRVTRDGTRVYILDTENKAVRLLKHE